MTVACLCAWQGLRPGVIVVFQTIPKGPSFAVSMAHMVVISVVILAVPQFLNYFLYPNSSKNCMNVHQVFGTQSIYIQQFN